MFELRSGEMDVGRILAVVGAAYAVAKGKPQKISLAGTRTLIFSGFFFATAWVALMAATIFFAFVSSFRSSNI